MDTNKFFPQLSKGILSSSIVAIISASNWCALSNLIFSKFEIFSENAHEELQKICTANIKKEIGKCTYTQMLNSDGGIEADLTVICIDKNHYRIISSAATRERDKFHIKKNISSDIELKDVTDNFCVFGLFGPKSRDLMKTLSNDNFENDDFSVVGLKGT